MLNGSVFQNIPTNKYLTVMYNIQIQIMARIWFGSAPDVESLDVICYKTLY